MAGRYSAGFSKRSFSMVSVLSRITKRIVFTMGNAPEYLGDVSHIEDKQIPYDDFA